MKRIFFSAGCLGLALSLGIAAQTSADSHSPVEKREAAMSTVGKSSKAIGEMLKGTTDFDAATANTALVAMRDAAEGFDQLYPDGTQGETSNKYLAGEKVWTDAAGFSAEVVKFQEALDAAIAADPQDKDALAAAFGNVGGTCKSCHEGYRVQQ